MSSTCEQPAVLGPRGLAETVARLRSDAAAVAEAIDAGVLLDLPELVLPGLALDLLQVSDTAAAAATVSVGRVHDSGALRTQGVISTRTWLQRHGRLAEPAAGAVLARARDLDRPELAATRHAWLAGAVAAGHVRAIALGLRGCERHLSGQGEQVELLYGPAQDQLLDIATDHTVEQTAAAAARLRAAVDPDGVCADAQAAYESQSLTCRQVGDQVVVDAVLDLPTGALLATALDRVVDKWHHAGTESGVPEVRQERRDHLHALALNQILTDWLGSPGAGTSRGARPHLNVHVDLADLLAGTGTGTLDVPGRDPALVPITTIARIACDADTTVILEALDQQHTSPGYVPADGDLLGTAAARLRQATREVLWLGRRHRAVTPRLWRYLVARDKHCRFPGCHRDPTRCEPHHVLEWEHGGPTDPENLILLCSAHHHLLHEGRWRITPDDRHPPGHPHHWRIHQPAPRPRLTLQR